MAALQYVVDLYRATETFPPVFQLAFLLQHREKKRTAVNQRAVEVSAKGSDAQLKNVELWDGSMVLGPRQDTLKIRMDKSWQVSDFT